THAALDRKSKLPSTSQYVELEHLDGDCSQADRDYIMQTYNSFSAELRSHLRQQTQPVSRTIRAKLTTPQPLFVTTYQELENYIETSLASCSDQAEKAACIEIIRTMMF